MNDILEFIEDLQMLDALDPVGRETHIQTLIDKYTHRVHEFEQEMEKQQELLFPAL